MPRLKTPDSKDKPYSHKAEATKQHLARVALELFADKGISETTTRDIAEAAEIAEGTIYRYFSSKEGLALELFLIQHRRLAEALRDAAASASTLQGKLAAITHAYCSLADTDWPLFRYHLLYQHRQYPQVPQDAHNPVEVLRGLLRDGMAKGEIPQRPLELVIGMGLGVVLQCAVQKIYGLLPEPLSDHADILAAAVWRVVKG